MAVAALIGAGVSAASSIFTGVQNHFSAKATTESLRSSADRAALEGEAAANQVRARSRRLAGAQRAAFAASGADLSGVAADVQYDSAVQYETDAMTEQYNANARVAQLETARNTTKMSGRNALVSGLFGAGGAVLGGIGKYDAIKNPEFVK